MNLAFYFTDEEVGSEKMKDEGSTLSQYQMAGVRDQRLVFLASASSALSLIPYGLTYRDLLDSNFIFSSKLLL